jgi:tetratricopeptide (TPR) repeat protein
LARPRLYDDRQPAEAESQLAEALGHYHAFVRERPRDLGGRYHLACANVTIGVARRRLKDLGGAKACQEQARDLFRELAAEDRSSAEYRSRLAECHTNLGVVLREMGRAPEARDAYREGITSLERALADFPGDPRLQKALALARYNLGNLLLDTDGPAAAEPVYRAAVPLWERQAADFPARSELRDMLGVSLHNLAIALSGQAKLDESLALLERATRLHEEVVRAGSRSAAHHSHLRNAYITHGEVLCKLGRHAGAAESAARAAKVLPKDPAGVVPAVRVLAECVRLAGQDGGLPEDRRRQLAAEYGRQAVALLRQAVARGHKDVGALADDPALKPLHGHPEFETFRSEVRPAEGP